MPFTTAGWYSCFITHALLLAGSGQRGTIVTSGVATQTLHLGNSAEPATLDPQIYTMMAEWEILSSLFEGLTNLANDGITILPGVVRTLSSIRPRSQTQNTRGWGCLSEPNTPLVVLQPIRGVARSSWTPEPVAHAH